MLGSSIRALGYDSKTDTRGAKRARVRAKSGPCAFRPHVRLLRVLRPSSTVRSLIGDGSTCNVVWASSSNRPVSDPSMAHLA